MIRFKGYKGGKIYRFIIQSTWVLEQLSKMFERFEYETMDIKG